MLTLKPVPVHRACVRAIIATRVSKVMELSERAFNELIKDIEEEPVFKKLMFAKNVQEKAISYRRFPRTDLSSRFYELKEEIAIDTTQPDIQSLLAKRKHTVALINKLGIEKFKEYFLYNDSDKPVGNIANQCGISISELIEINHLLNEVSVHNEFYQPSTIISPKLSYTNIGAIEDDGVGGFIIKFSTPNLARGKYTINYEKIEKMKNQQILSKKELKSLKELLKKIELVNLRKSTLLSIIQKLVELQTLFLKTKYIADMRPFTQRQLAVILNFSPSTICRLISMKSVNTPWGKEMPLKNLFSSKKTVCKRLTEAMVKDERKVLSDRKIKELIGQKFNIHISRSLINSCRKELSIPSSFDRT